MELKKSPEVDLRISPGRRQINDYVAVRNFSGDQLLTFQERWKELGTPPHVLRLITGTRISLVSKPRMIRNWRHSRFITRLSPSEQIALLKHQGILIRSERKGPSFVSRMFLVKKSSGGVRSIFDLRSLNAHVRIKKFQLISHYKIPEFLQDNDYMTRIDIAQAYFHVPIAENHQQLFRLIYDKELLQMTSLPLASHLPHIPLRL